MKLLLTFKNSLTGCDMNVITRSSHDITPSNSHISNRHDCFIPGCDITNHISLQDIVASLKKVYVIGKSAEVKML